MSPGLLKVAVGVSAIGGVAGHVQDVINTYDRMIPDLRGLGEEELNELFRFHMRCLVALGRPGSNSFITEPPASLSLGLSFSTFANLVLLAAMVLGVLYLRMRRAENDSLGDFKETRTIYRPPPKVVSVMTKDRHEALAQIKASGIVSAEEEFAREKLEDAETTAFYALQFKCKEGAKAVEKETTTAKMLQRVGRGCVSREALKPTVALKNVQEVERKLASLAAMEEKDRDEHREEQEETEETHEETPAETPEETPEDSPIKEFVIPPLPVFSRMAHDDYLLDTSRSLNDTYGSILTDPVGGLSSRDDNDDIEQLVTPLKTTFRLPQDEACETLTPSPATFVTPKKEAVPLQKRRFTSASSTKKEPSARRFTTPSNDPGRKSSIRRPSTLKTPLTARRRGSAVAPKKSIEQSKMMEKVEQEETKVRDRLRFLFLGERHTIEANFKKGRKKIQDTVVASCVVPRAHKEYKATFNTFSRLADTSTKSVSMKTRRNKEEKVAKVKHPKKPRTMNKVIKCLLENTERRVSGVTAEDDDFTATTYLSCPVLGMSDEEEEEDIACFLDGTVTPPAKCNKVELIIPCEPPVLDNMEEDADESEYSRERRFSYTFNDIAEESVDMERIGAIIDQLETPRVRRASTFKPETLSGKVERLLALAKVPRSRISIHDLELAVASRNISDVLKFLHLKPVNSKYSTRRSFSPYHASPPRHM